MPVGAGGPQGGVCRHTGPRPEPCTGHRGNHGTPGEEGDEEGSLGGLGQEAAARPLGT